ncbi:hypothetical protein D3C85_1526250 [compost metagenome]
MAAHQAGIHATLTRPNGTERRDAVGRHDIEEGLDELAAQAAGLLEHLAYQVGVGCFEAGIAHLKGDQLGFHVFLQGERCPPVEAG